MLRKVRTSAVSTAATATATEELRLGHVVEFLVDILIRIFQKLDEFLRLLGIVAREEAVGRALGARAGRATDAMHVVFRLRRVIEIDDDANVFHI